MAILISVSDAMKIINFPLVTVWIKEHLFSIIIFPQYGSWGCIGASNTFSLLEQSGSGGCEVATSTVYCTSG